MSRDKLNNIMFLASTLNNDELAALQKFINCKISQISTKQLNKEEHITEEEKEFIVQLIANKRDLKTMR